MWNVGPPRLRVEEAALDVASACRTELDTAALLADVVQLRRTTAPRLIAALDPFAASGAPTAAALSSELRAILPALTQAAAPQVRDGSMLDRLQAGASRLVKVRPIDAPAGDDPDLVVQRVDANAQRGSVTGALVELAKLTAPVRAPADAWIAKAQARDAAVKAAQTIAADTYGALARPVN